MQRGDSCWKFFWNNIVKQKSKKITVLLLRVLGRFTWFSIEMLTEQIFYNLAGTLMYNYNKV